MMIRGGFLFAAACCSMPGSACSKLPGAEAHPTDAALSSAATTAVAPEPIGAGVSASIPSTPVSAHACGDGRRMTVHVYDVGQALAALVDLPDGRHVLVDTGDSPTRRGCGALCVTADRRLLGELRADLHGAPIDLLWITHQHSDHIGGAAAVLDRFVVKTYVDNGRDPRKAEVAAARAAAARRATAERVVDPERRSAPIAGSPDVRLTPILPTSWPASCSRNPNECSIALRIDFCASSVLFTGDAEHDEEANLDPHGDVTLLQVAHHGSETATTPRFLMKLRPRYAVISAGKPGEGLNAEYCHPRALITTRLTKLLGGPGSKTLASFDGDRCANAKASDWVDVPTSDRLWATERDGDVVLTTTGDGAFVREK